MAYTKTTWASGDIISFAKLNNLEGGVEEALNRAMTPGPKGETGEAGPQGPKGDKGDKGDTGAAGAAGEAGSNGKSVAGIELTFTKNADGAITAVAGKYKLDGESTAAHNITCTINTATEGA